jgi:hypothetical protein
MTRRRSHSNSKNRRNSHKRHSGLRCESLEARLMFNADMGDLAAMNDEFDDPSSIDQWQLVTQTENWGAQHLATLDIDQSTPGALTIEPHTSTWYQDYQGELVFKEVTGDFMVTTYVSITDRDNIGDSDGDDIPDGSSFSLGGVMLRTPRNITDAATQWTPGESNFVFLSLGHGYDGASMSLESKNTASSISELDLIPLNTTSAELRIERSGSMVTTMYRLEVDAPWVVAANFDRPDMPEALQVGVVGYTDYEKTATFAPFYANSHTLIDTPENSANSSNPGMAYAPDVRASFDYIRFERPESQATSPALPAMVTTEIAVANAGFEDIAGETTVNEFTFGALPGWELYDPGNVTSGGDGPQYYIGTLTPGEVPSEPGVIQNFPGGAAEGQRVGIAFNFDGSGDGGEYGLQQTLNATLEASTNYSLFVDVGNIATGIALSGQTFLLDGLPGYRVELLAGETILAADENSLFGSIAEGGFGTSVVTFQAAADDPRLGQALRIRLINLNQTVGVPTGNDLEVDFDNIRLEATSLLFQPIGDQQIHHDETLSIALPPETPNGVPLTYSVELVGSELWDLDEQYNLEPGGVAADGTPLYYENYQDYGVRWLRRAGSDEWMFLESDGTLHEWLGNIAASPSIASLGIEVFASPSQLHDAINVGTATLEGTTLHVAPAVGFVGTIQLSVTKTAGELNQVEVVAVAVTNVGPVLPTIGNSTMATDDILLIDLPTADADGDLIIYEVEVIENIAADLRDELAIVADAGLVSADYGFNYLGQQERWVQATSGWLFITTSGSVHSWTGSSATSPVVARLDARYHADPSLLVQAQHVNVSTTYTNGQLQVSVADGYVGELHLRLRATDGVETLEETFTIDVTASAWPSLVDAIFADDEDA